MFRINKLFLFQTLSCLLLIACEPFEIVQPNSLEVKRTIVASEQIPEVTSALMGKLGMLNSAQGAGTYSSEIHSDSGLQIDWNHIRQLVDSTGRSTYVFAIDDNETGPGVFYNLVFRLSPDGEPHAPYLLKFKMSDEFLTQYLISESLDGFSGSVQKIMISSNGWSSGRSTANSDIGVKEGEACPGAGLGGGGSTGGGGGSPPPPGSDIGWTCELYMETYTWYQRVCLNGVCSDYEVKEREVSLVYECNVVQLSSSDSSSDCEFDDGEVPIIKPKILDPCKVSKDEIGEAFPDASETAKDKLSSIINDYADKFGIDSKEKLQHFLAQASHESGGFKDIKVSENLNYTSERLLVVFSKYFAKDDPDKKNPDDFAGNSEAIANYVYASRMGNGDQASGDGYKYRGRGIFQITGKSNYESFNSFYESEFDEDVDFVENPGLLASDEKYAIMSALWFYKTNVLDKLSITSNTTVEDVTKKVNGGTNGLSDRESKFDSAKEKITDCEN